jgi:hypothetical protein
MDRLENQIRKNREALDKYDPSPDVWKRIRSGCKSRKIYTLKWISIAAMFVIILGSAVVIFIYSDIGIPSKSEKILDARLRKTNPHLRETEIYYNNLLNSLYLEVAPLLTGHPEIEQELNSDISHIDSLCAGIKNDLRDNVDNQEVIEALIRNYRLKIRILEDMLSVLKQNENDDQKSRNYEL